MRTPHGRTAAVTLCATLLASALLAGCGAAGKAPTSTPLPSATSTATPLPTVDATAVAQACGQGVYFGLTSYRLGDLIVSEGFSGLTYPARKLPDTAPLQPFKLAADVGVALDQQLPVLPFANPAMGQDGGFVLQVCNASATQSHELENVVVRIDTLAPYTGQLSSWNLCDGSYSRPSPSGGGCGGAMVADEFLNAVFAANAGAGSTATAMQVSGATTGPSGTPITPLPITLAPGKSLFINTSATLPTTVGTYTFSLGLTADHAATPFLPVAGQALFAPVAHKFDAVACESASMQAQIPAATNPPTYYICPES